MVIIGLLLVSIRANTLLANYPIVPDLTIESMQQEGMMSKPFQLKIVDANVLDSKVWLPLPENISFIASQNEHGSVTYDATNHQLVIDWNNQEEENRYVTIELRASEAGSYEFQANVMREEESVASQPVAINIIEDAYEEEVEVPVENEQPEVVEEEHQKEPSAETQQKIENIEQPIIENEAAETRVGETDDPRIGLPIKDIFPDPMFAKQVARTLEKEITDPLTREDVETTTMIEVVRFEVTSIEGIDVFKNLENLYAAFNKIEAIPESIENLTELKLIDFYQNKIETIPESIGNLTKLEYLDLGSNFKIGSLPESIWSLTELKLLNISGMAITSISEDLGKLTKLDSLMFLGCPLTSLPKSIGKLNLTGKTLEESGQGTQRNTGNLAVDLTYLPSDAINQLNLAFPYLKFMSVVEEVVPGMKVQYLKLSLSRKDISVTIDEDSKWQELTQSKTLMGFLNTKDQFSTQDYLLDGYTNDQGEAIDIEDYVKNGQIIKSGVIHGKVRAAGSGVFPNNSDNALTDDSIKIELIKREVTLASAPSTISFGDSLTIGTENKTYPLKSFDAPLTIVDNRINKSPWTVSAKMTKELTSPNNKVLENSLHYRLNGEDNILNKTELNIYTQQNTSDEPFNISDTWLKDDLNGLFLEIKAGQALAEEYTGTIEWKLQDVPSNATE